MRFIVCVLLALLAPAAIGHAGEVNGERRVLVMMLNFTNTVQPAYTPATISAAMAKADQFVAENSYGLADLSYTVLNWQRMAIAAPATGCILNHISNPSIASEGNRLALAQGVNPAVYDHLVYLTPAYSTAYCVGADVDKRPGRVWIEQSTAPSWSRLAHEIIHNFGAWHAHAWDCGNAALLPAGCRAYDAGGYGDIMGSGVPGHVNAAIKEGLGWLEAQDANVSGDYTIRPLSSSPSALSLILFDGRTLYIEYRQPTGFDAPLKAFTGSNILRGLKLTVMEGPAFNQTYMLDATPLTSQLTEDGALEVGRSFVYGDVTVTCLSLNATQAVVRVSFN